MSFTRQLIIRTDQTITTPINLMLTFDKVPPTARMDQVAWRVIEFGGPNQSAYIVYEHNLMFSSVQVDYGNNVIASAVTAISLGQETTLVTSGGAVAFTAPTERNTGEAIAINKTGEPQGIAIGFIDAVGRPNPLLVWQNVGNKMDVKTTFIPVLMSVYATFDYQEAQLITNEIVSPLLLRQNLESLPRQQVYTLSMNTDGSYSLVGDQQAIPSVRPKVKFDPRLDDYLIGPDGHISVKNNLRSIIHVKVTSTTNRNGSEAFFPVKPGTTECWNRQGAEVISVNVGGVGRVANFFGVLGKTLQINAA